MRVCKVEGCDKKYRSNGFCNKHNQQHKRTGSPFKTVKTVVQKIPALTEKIIICDNGCWLFTGPWDNDGYGRLHINGERHLATRLMMSIVLGFEITDEFVLHKCDNPPCVNPAHLFLGTAKDNAIDMMIKGRSKSNVLEDFEVIEIRDMHKYGYTGKALAEMFNVDKSTISLIVNNKRWNHL